MKSCSFYCLLTLLFLSLTAYYLGYGVYDESKQSKLSTWEKTVTSTEEKHKNNNPEKNT
jgi:hypothetical protein